MRIPAAIARAMVHVYRHAVSPFLPVSCRYLPTCSEYALDAIAEYGALRGSALALARIARCHPWGGAGYDPVPPRHAHADR